jgi:hypothetical protein
LKAPGSKRLKLEHEKLLSIFAFNLNLRCYNEWAATDAFERVVMKDLADLRAATAHLGQAYTCRP